MRMRQSSQPDRQNSAPPDIRQLVVELEAMRSPRGRQCQEEVRYRSRQLAALHRVPLAVRSLERIRSCGSQVSVFHFLILSKFFRGTRKNYFARLDHISSVRNSKSKISILLDEKDGHAKFAINFDDLFK